MPIGDSLAGSVIRFKEVVPVYTLESEKGWDLTSVGLLLHPAIPNPIG